MSILNGVHSGFESSKISQPSTRRPLSSMQERKLVDYLDEQFLDLTRNYKKRSEASSNLQTLSSYIQANRRILALILQIPPIDPSTGLRIAYFLRLTGDALGSIPGYKLSSTSETVYSTLHDLIDFLDDIDQGWVAVLQGQVWDPEAAEGVDLILPITAPGSSVANGSSSSNKPYKSTPPSQTDIARLRSLLFSGESALEEWLTNERAEGNVGNMDEVDDISGMLQQMGLLDRFDSLFARTLDFLGGFGANVARNVVQPASEAMME
ncbi:hypothetical protein M413DRAFT_59458 [Hebeloma cylindrosporum]|uniref:Uncharacterized protein n=1 Tax=Hebeloma cylindrosporum TaxID=76867 RepID=A0A0C3D0S8_HEBCY|nr:hypothetical protein M413DRAFT_59458 [Hebeloma cylindrosporum h7]